MPKARTRRWALARLGCILGASLLAGCSTDRAAAPTAAAEPRAAPVRGAPPEALAGRWMLASPGSSSCGMNFGAAPGAAEGTIAPEGGCPGNFFTSRKWTFENGSLVIRDHNGEPLGQLALAAPSRFEGKAAAGAALSLTR
jgi:protease inhibitor Inh